jgi:hypothetical protein
VLSSGRKERRKREREREKEKEKERKGRKKEKKRTQSNIDIRMTKILWLADEQYKTLGNINKLQESMHLI